MRRWTAPALGVTLLLAILLRLRPLLSFDIWGSDSGEYFFLTRELVEKGFMSTEYHGWGLAYQYFPGAEVLIGATHLTTGLGLLPLLKVLLPVVSSFAVLIVFLIGRTAFFDERAGLVAAAIVAVAMPHVFATSHAMPGALGDLLMGLCMLLFLKTYEDGRALPALMLATLALIPTHHMSTMFLIVPVVVASLLREFIRSRGHLSWTVVDMMYIPFLIVATLVYWLVLAVPFRDEVMTKAFDLHPSFIMAIAVGILLLAVLVVVLRRRYLKFRYVPRFPDVGREMVLLVVTMSVIGAFLLSTAFVSVPGSDIQVQPLDVLYLVPVSVLFGLAIIGIGPAEFGRKGLFVLSWALAAVMVLAVGIVTRNTVLVPYRILQYITFPLALLTAWGLVYLIDTRLEPSGLLQKRVKAGVAAVLSTIIVVAGATAYPPNDLLGGFEEGTLVEEMDAVLWCGGEVPVRGTMVATDHRMSSMLFGFAGLNATWDSAKDTLHEDLDGSREELRSVDAPVGWRRIDYVLIDDTIKEGVALLQWENAEPMSDEAIDKFYEPPFQKVYDSNGVEIFFVGVV